MESCWIFSILEKNQKSTEQELFKLAEYKLLGHTKYFFLFSSKPAPMNYKQILKKIGR